MRVIGRLPDNTFHQIIQSSLEEYVTGYRRGHPVIERMPVHFLSNGATVHASQVEIVSIDGWRPPRLAKNIHW